MRPLHSSGGLFNQTWSDRFWVQIVARGARAMTTTRYTKDHEWIRIDGDSATVGISTYAQAQLGDIVYVELPALGKCLGKGEEAAVVESVKAASEVYAPVAGEVTAVNTELDENPGSVNSDAEGSGWFLKLKVADAAELEDLMSEEQYKAFLETIG
jgi:glycine cleavage system H protein